LIRFYSDIKELDRQGIWQVWETGEMCIGSWWGYLRERDHLEDLGVDERIMLKWISQKRMEAWTRLIWLWIRTVGGML
jgi:hypothetical protein